MPQFNGKTDYPDRNYRRQGRNDGFKNPFNFDEGSGAGGVDLGGDQEGRKNYQPSFKLGDASKVEEKSDEVEVEEEAKAKEDSVVQPQEESMAAPKKADEIFKKMKQSGLIPNAVAMLDGLCKDGLVHEAMKLFGMMREKGSMPEVVVYTAVVEGFCQAQNFDDAKRIFRKMQNNGIVPNAFSYTVLIRGLCKGKRLDDAVEICVEMLENGHSPNVTTFTELVLEFCKEKGVEEAQNIILTLKQKGFLLDEKAVRTYLDKNGPTSPLVWEAIFGAKKTAHRPI
uniref:Pentatricopeptide repeat-containing protein n=1 Tax=Chenopodium quinoa TaxID=63459 RepID=A0A803LGW6_CHEQI